MDSLMRIMSTITLALCVVAGYGPRAAMASVAAPPSPDNAALVYYQAFLLHPGATSSGIPASISHAVFRDLDLPQEVREYVRKHDGTIDLIRAASRIEHCDWGMDGLLKAQASSLVTAQSRYAVFLVCSSARVLAVDGDYRSALADALVARRVATHLVKGSSLFFAESISLDGWALQCIQCILGTMPPNEATLGVLEGEMLSSPPVSDELWSKFDKAFERNLWQWRTQPNGFPRIRDQLLRWASSKVTSGNDPAMSDEDLLEMVQKPFVASWHSVRHTLASDMPYEETYARLEQLANELREKCLAEPSGFRYLYPSVNLEGVPHLYNIKLAHRSHVNAIVAAIEIYRAYATTGQLVQELWDSLPRDPYSGKAFIYEQTTNGFVLRCRIKPTDQTEAWKYEFHVSEDVPVVVGEERGQALK